MVLAMLVLMIVVFVMVVVLGRAIMVVHRRSSCDDCELAIDTIG